MAGREEWMETSNGDCKRVGSSVVEWAHLIDVFVSAALFPRFIFPHPQNRTKNRYSERPPYLRFMTFLLVFPQLGLELITFLKRLLLRRFGFLLPLSEWIYYSNFITFKGLLSRLRKVCNKTFYYLLMFC